MGTAFQKPLKNNRKCHCVRLFVIWAELSHKDQTEVCFIYSRAFCAMCVWGRGHMIYLKATLKFVENRSQETQYVMTRFSIVSTLTKTANGAIHPKKLNGPRIFYAERLKARTHSLEE